MLDEAAESELRVRITVRIAKLGDLSEFRENTATISLASFSHRVNEASPFSSMPTTRTNLDTVPS